MCRKSRSIILMKKIWKIHKDPDENREIVRRKYSFSKQFPGAARACVAARGHGHQPQMRSIENIAKQSSQKLHNRRVDTSLPANSRKKSVQEIVAVCLNAVKECSFVSESTPFNPHWDFNAEITNGQYKHENANKLVAFVQVLEQDLSFLTGNPKKVFKIDVLCVSKACQGKGIGRQLVEKSLENAVKEDCEYVATVATAVASQNIFSKDSSFLFNKISAFYEKNRAKSQKTYKKYSTRV
nr:hypothetical protein T10B5.4 - Caenorhabditis elegans [Caenorhabditis elegans]